MSRSSAGHWTRPGSAPDPVERCWCASTGPEERRRPPEFLARRPGVLQRGVHASRAHAADPRAPSLRPPGPRPTTLTASPGMVRTSLRPADLVDLTAWPEGMRVNRAPRAAPPGRPAALRGRGRLPADRLRHQHKSRSARRSRGPPPATSPLPGDRIRCAKDTGLDRFPLQGFAQNRIWCLIVALARRPAGLLPAARHGRRPRPRLGAPDDPPAADEHPRCHHSPCPPHRPALQGRPPLHRPPADRTEQLSGPTGSVRHTAPASCPPRS